MVAGADFLAVSAGVWTHAGGPAEAVRALNAEMAAGVAARRHRVQPKRLATHRVAERLFQDVVRPREQVNQLGDSAPKIARSPSEVTGRRLTWAMDTLTTRERSERMARVKHKDSKAELTVRRLVHRLGYRYRLHRSDLPGTPDLVFAARHKIIFVHGCFWHRHPDPRCKLARLPKSRQEFWAPKLEGNRLRDLRVQAELRHHGWRALTVWECELNDRASLESGIRTFLDQ